MPVGSDHAEIKATHVLQPMIGGSVLTAGWVLRRAALGLLILFVAMGSVAWLTYASIDPVGDRSDTGSPRTQAETTLAGY